MYLVEDKIGSMLEGISDATERLWTRAGHSTRDAVHRLGHVRYDAMEHVYRARHAHATYEKHYKRVVPARVTTAAQQHPLHGELTADEVLFL